MATPIPGTSKWQTDWSKCCLCQEVKPDHDLISPTTRYTQKHDGYTMIATNIPLFHALHEMPIVLDPARLDEGGGIEETLRKNKACYHHFCRLMFNNTKLERARKRQASGPSTTEGRTKQRRTSREGRDSQCFICESEEPASELRKAMTMKLNDRLQECARNLDDGRLLALLSGGDVVAQELKYHFSCLTGLYNRERDHLKSIEKEKQVHHDQRHTYPLAFSELVTYIVETRSNSDGPSVFRLADLASLYKQRLEQLGLESPDVNPTRLKDKLLEKIPELSAQRKGRDILLAFQKDVGLALSQAASDYSDAMTLANAAKILRRHMLDHQSKFDGTFDEDCIKQTLPASLLQFVAMVEHGADIKSQLRFGVAKTDLAIAQLLQYNCFYSKHADGERTTRHSTDRETPFPVYIGTSVYARTRKKALVELLHEHGVSISYNRVLEISAQMGDAAVNKYVDDGVICPLILRKGLFTTAAMDNIDHNPTATTATTSFHGTSVSLFQHPTKDQKGEEREPLEIGVERIKTVPELPDFYTNVKPAFFAKKNPSPPKGGVEVPDASLLRAQLDSEFEWLEKVNDTEGLDPTQNVTWSAHHASKKRCPEFEASITSLLPLLRDPAHSVATVKHVMDKVRDAVSFLNPGQVPVLAADQPIYAVAKQIQWHWPEQYGEEKFVIMFGGLHIEMAALRSIGTFLQDSGWTGALVEAGVASSGTAESYLTASSITRTRQIHQVTSCSLYQLMKEAYKDYCEETPEHVEEVMSFEAWCEKRKSESPQFQFWHLVLSMELAILLLVRSFREANFRLYCQSLTELIPYFFANNNTNYARWLPVHLRDMLTLKEKHPQLAQEFESGKFVVHKSNREFSAMAIDQAHEQANAVIKGDGGAIGITEDPSALRRWMVAGPQVSRLVAEYEAASESKESVELTSHHEQTPRAQKDFLEKVQKLSKTLKDLGNPFQEENQDLLSLDMKDIADPSAAQQVSKHLPEGQTRFSDFMKKLAEEDVSSFYEPIKKNKMDFFRQQSDNACAVKRNPLKEDCQLFSKLFISCQSRECDLHEFFRHENQQYPASLSDGGKLHGSQKSQLATILENYVTTPDSEPEADTIVIDGSAMVNSLPPRSAKSFEDYATQVILPHIAACTSKYQRTDIVFDVYKTLSLKSETRTKRGHGVRRRVTSMGKVPRNWMNFLRDSENKTELFNFLAQNITRLDTPNTVVVTKEDSVVCNKEDFEIEELAPCSHEEADTRIFLHARNSVERGSKAMVIKANDTDVLVLAVSFMSDLKTLGLDHLWMAFGQGHNLRWIPVHDLHLSIGPEKSKGILFFHAFTGCDVVSGFRGKGKKSAWQTWNVCPEASDVFIKLSRCTPTIDDDDLKTLEKFVVTMYDRSSTTERVDDARLDLFARKQRQYDAIPPTRAALVQHTRRAVYEAGYIWSQSTQLQPEIPSPADWGWTEVDGVWKVFWTTLPPIADSCKQLTKCGCKSVCRGRCKCVRFGLVCTALCSCTCED